jgi:hypothetical protein
MAREVHDEHDGEGADEKKSRCDAHGFRLLSSRWIITAEYRRAA